MNYNSKDKNFNNKINVIRLILLKIQYFTIVNQREQPDGAGPLHREVAHRSFGEARRHHVLDVAHGVWHEGVADEPSRAVGRGGDIAHRVSVDIDMLGEGGGELYCVYLGAVDCLGRVTYCGGRGKIKPDTHRGRESGVSRLSGYYHQGGERVGAQSLKADDVMECLFHVVRGCAGLCAVVRGCLKMTGVVVIFI